MWSNSIMAFTADSRAKRSTLTAGAVLFMALALGGPPAAADENNLSGGVLLTHHPPQLQYSSGYDLCEQYEEFVISSCEEQVNRIDLNGDEAVSVWYVVAAWDEPKTWCGTEFGFGTFNPDAFYFSDYGACLPNHLELSTNGWPGPNEGTVVVATDVVWSGNFLPVYYFVGRAYYVDTIPLSVDPAQEFAGFGNCSVPPEIWNAQLGVLGLFTDGVYLCPPEAIHACCDPATGDCLLLTEDECESAEGIWLQETDSCDPNPCTPTPARTPVSWGEVKALYEYQ